jgi:Transposase and inactivated derivatives
MKPIPNEIRQRILDDCNDGMTEVEAAEKWKVSPSFITKLKRHVRETGSVEPKHGKTGAKRKLESCRELLQKMVKQTPDATLEEIRDQLPVDVTTPTVFNELRRLKLVYKKNN